MELFWNPRKLEVSDRLSIRYLGAILDLPTFWKYEYYETHKLTAIQLLKKLLFCAKEIGLDADNQREEEEKIFSDTEGIDLLAHSVLIGVRSWLKHIDVEEINFQCWFSDLQALLDLLVK
jgi:hypothetical protein